MLHRKYSSALVKATQVALLYGCLGAVWIFFSDRVVHAMAASQGDELALQTYKGWLYVAVTALLAFALWYRFQLKIEQGIDALRRSERTCRTMLESIGDAVIATDAQGHVRWMNPLACQLTGWPESEAIGKKTTDIFRIINSQTQQTVEDPVSHVLASGLVIGLANHALLLSRDGREIPISDSGAPILDEGKVTGVILVFQDVTEAYRLQEAIRKNEERLRMALNAVEEGVIEADPKQLNNVWSPHVFEIMGLDPTTTKPGPEAFASSLHEDDVEKARADWERIKVAVGEKSDMVYRLKKAHPENPQRWIRVRGEHLALPSGETQVYGTVHDITEDMVLNERLRLVQFAIETAAFSIYQINEKGHLYYVNQHACQQLGYEREALIGLHLSAIDPDFEETWWQVHRDTARREGSRIVKRNHRRKDGSIFPVQVQVNYFVFEGKPVSFSFVTDLTERTEYERQLIEARDAAEASSRAKAEFLAVISHEMRTPLNPILGFASLLYDQTNVPDNKAALATIISAAERLLALIENILHYTKLDRSEFKPKLAPCCLHDICEQALAEIRLQGGNLTITLDTAPQPPAEAVPQDCLVEADSHLLQRLLDNLLTNACKYTPSGRVTLHLSANEPTVEGHTVDFLFAVSDTGIGLDPGLLPELFEPFRQADASSTRAHEGVGLGLAICRKIVHLLGGQIDAESTPGKGSRFWFTLPLRVLSNESNISDAEPMATPATEGSKKILIVDDEANNAMIAQTILKLGGYETHIAEDGDMALALCQEAPFDLILLDLNMPRLDGYEMARQLRSDSSSPNQQTPILALSAHASEQVIERCLQAGIQDHIEKPIRNRTFLKRIYAFFESQNG